MTGEEKYNEFLKKIADYSASHGLDLVPYNDSIDQIVNVSRFELTKFTSEELERARQYISDDWMPDSSINKEAYRYLGGPYTSRYDSMNGLWKGE